MIIRFAKLKRRNASPRYDLTYRIYFGPTDMHAQFFEGNVLNLAHSAQLQCLSGERRLLVVVGNLQVKVTYLDHISKVWGEERNCLFACLLRVIMFIGFFFQLVSR